jgi:predicted nucleic acid-binding protein
MNGKMLYLDACSWCRPYDNLSQPRIYIESEAILEILHLCKLKSWRIAASEVIEIELMRIKDTEKLDNVKGLYEEATEYLTLTNDIKLLAQIFQQYGLKKYDSLHLATAQINGYDVLLTTDDNFRRKALKMKLNIQVYNPVEWLLEESENGTNSND